MAMDFPIFELGELCDVSIGRTPPRNEFKWFNQDAQSFKWVSIRDMGNCDKYLYKTSETITVEGQREFNIPIVPCNTVILSFKLTIGRVAITGSENMLTNEANKEINEQQLAWARENYELEKAENRFLVDQAYERELENRTHQEQYDSPEATKQRWIDAGFNPSLMMSPTGLQSGSVGSVGSSVGSAPRHNQPNMIPMQQGSPSKSFPIPRPSGI